MTSSILLPKRAASLVRNFLRSSMGFWFQLGFRAEIHATISLITRPWTSVRRMSYDDGMTWPDARIIFPYTTAYSDIAVLSDGRIAVLFERDNHTKIDLAILSLLGGPSPDNK